MILLEKLRNWTPLQKLPKNVGDLGKLIVAKGPKANKSPNLLTLCLNDINWSKFTQKSIGQNAIR